MKKILIGAFVAMVAFVSNASYLYWTVDSEYKAGNTGNTYIYSSTEEGTYNFAYARVKVYQGSISDASELSDVNGYVNHGYTTDAGGGQKSWAIDVSAYETGGYSFVIELMAWDAEANAYSQVGISQSKTYSELASEKMIYENTSFLPTAEAVWHGTPMNAPEPTSAMLMLLGVAGLALKRKQRKAE